MIDRTTRIFTIQLFVAGPIIGRQQADFVRDDFTHKVMRGLSSDVLQDTRAITLPLRCTAPITGVLPEASPPVFPVFLSQCRQWSLPPRRFHQPRQCRQASLWLHHCGADFVRHIQRSFVRAKAHLPLDLQRANSLFAGGHQVHDLEPLPERLVRVLKDRPGNDRKPIAVRRAFFALPVPFARRKVIHTLDFHNGDSARLEAIAGPSNTLWAASRRPEGTCPQIGLRSFGGLAWRTFCHSGYPLNLG